jgi:RNA polymerase sigma-70 factor (ECF subfamily)
MASMSLSIDAVAASDEPAETWAMDEEEFREFYARTARPLHGYLRHISGSATLADDLLQESYYRFLRAKLPAMTADQSKSYLFRIAGNLMRDHLRGAKHRDLPASDAALAAVPGDERADERAGTSADFGRVFSQLKPRYRELLWLAYVEGSSHEEIARVAGLKTQSVRPLLFRAREKLIGLLRKRGLAPERAGE